MKALHISDRPVAQPTPLDLVTGTPAYIHNRPTEKPLTISGLTKEHFGTLIFSHGEWRTR
jgi:hypothetical protein